MYFTIIIIIIIIIVRKCYLFLRLNEFFFFLKELYLIILIFDRKGLGKIFNYYKVLVDNMENNDSKGERDVPTLLIRLEIKKKKKGFFYYIIYLFFIIYNNDIINIYSICYLF